MPSSVHSWSPRCMCCSAERCGLGTKRKPLLLLNSQNTCDSKRVGFPHQATLTLQLTQSPQVEGSAPRPSQGQLVTCASDRPAINWGFPPTPPRVQ